MISNISFGQKFAVSTSNNSPEAFKQFKAYCQVRSELIGKTLYDVEESKDSKEKVCVLDIHDKLSPQVDTYCKMFGINYTKIYSKD